MLIKDARRKIMMHASNGEAVLFESECGGICGVHFSQSCNSILARTKASACRAARLIVCERQVFHLYTIIWYPVARR